ncbi:ABC transporter substrate-binding protein [Paenibacillus lentus]|uniref:ABC transporter substrate-binding protein n=1 Tax=Paenibacillus lentus TaxID=1338368 RepID=UPI003647DFD3
MRIFITYILVFCTIFLSGCIGQPSSSELNDNGITLNIGYFSEQQFENRYSSLLAIEYPHLNYNVIPTNELITGKQSIQEWAANNSVDLIYLPPDYLQSFKNNGLLKELDSYIQKTSFPLGSYVPSIVELMKQYGDGQLYGLAPTFYGRALAYNPHIFDQYGAEYPGDQMTWEEIIELTRQFPKGLSLSYPTAAHFLINVGQTQNLQAYSEDTNRITLNSPSWTKLLELVQEPLRDGHIEFHDLNNNLFITGEYAMSVITYDELTLLEQQDSTLEWKLVTMPTHPSEPDSSHHYALDGMWAIPSTSTESDAAWELIQFFMSDQVAKWSYRSVHGFSSLTAYTFMGQSNTNIEAFYKLKPTNSASFVPNSIYDLLNRAVEQILTGEMTSEQALAVIANAEISLEDD